VETFERLLQRVVVHPSPRWCWLLLLEHNGRPMPGADNR
jgi:hypothetical protein